VGSGGTQAGLTAGFSMNDSNTKVTGVSVLHGEKEARIIVDNLTDKILSHLGYELGNSQVNVEGDYVGEGYGLVTSAAIDAIKLVARLEGIFLCPVYTGKAMAGLIDLIRQNKIKAQDNVVFIHTGGTPLIHAYYDKFIGKVG
jgi:1-aminocyclopropane-1-carboxylate deaminase/D-cysteine desulfhydrase-like pyridoxal-dependent ACC family enzyme